MNDDQVDMNEAIVTIKWCAEDIKAIRPDWDDARCARALKTIAKGLHEGSVSYGWAMIESQLIFAGLED